MIFYATKETMQRYKLKTPEQLSPEVAPYDQAVVKRERGSRLYEWGCKLFYVDGCKKRHNLKAYSDVLTKILKDRIIVLWPWKVCVSKFG